MSAAASPLDPGAPRLWSVPSGPGFVDAVASVLAETTGLRDDPEALASAQIFVPNQRSARAFARALLQASDRDGFLSPAIRPLGDIAGEPPSTLLTGLGVDAPPAMDEDRRLGLLMRLVRHWGERNGRPFAPASALAAARELGELLDQAAAAGREDWSDLPGLVTDASLATHWEESLKFLEIISDNWPGVLSEHGASEPHALRRLAAIELTRQWHASPPDGPVIIAGSTGATPMSRALMAAALGLEKGLVILPGVEHDMAGETAAAIAEEPSHPQHVLVRTLQHLRHAPSEVATWPVASGDALGARRRLISAALAPTRVTADWMERIARLSAGGDTGAFMRNALAGLTRVEAETEAEEARLAALLLRETLETPDRTAALVTPDATISRRVAAELARWDIHVEPSAGTPLLRTPRGALAGRLLGWLADPGDPVAILSVLKHERVSADPDAVERLEARFLRGPRNWEGLDGLARRVAEAPDLAEMIQGLSDLAGLWPAPGAHGSLETGARCLAQILETLCGEGEDASPWSGRDGEALARWLRRVAEMGDAVGSMPVADMPALMLSVAEAETVIHPGRRHPRLQILGPLEARLISLDRVVLAGLNEGIWPASAGAEAFLPRRFRTELGLPDPEERVGLAAHDFASLAAAEEVFLLRAKRVDSQPAVPSRWWWRLSAIAEGALEGDAADVLGAERAARLLGWARGLDRTVPDLPRGADLRPEPRPPVTLRPTVLSVTQVETLIRDPYAIYARKVLGLEALGDVGAEIDAAGRGTAVHRAIEVFETLAADEQTADTLFERLNTELREHGQSAAQLRAEAVPLRRSAEEFLAWREARLPQIVETLNEVGLKHELEIGGTRFMLKGRADRVEIHPGGAVSIMDFKTGAPPSMKQVEAGLAPQLPLLAALALQGGLEGRSASGVDALLYLRVGAGLEEKSAGDKASTPDEKAQKAWDGLLRLLGIYVHGEKGYPSKPVAQFIRPWGDYDRLARRAEWADLGAGEGGET